MDSSTLDRNSLKRGGGGYNDSFKRQRLYEEDRSDILIQRYSNRLNSQYYQYLVNWFDSLSVEVIVKIFSFIDPFSTPLAYICKRWYQILQNNHNSLWRDLVMTITDTHPFAIRPTFGRIISYFNRGFGKSLHNFTLTTHLSSFNNGSKKGSKSGNTTPRLLYNSSPSSMVIDEIVSTNSSTNFNSSSINQQTDINTNNNNNISSTTTTTNRRIGTQITPRLRSASPLLPIDPTLEESQRRLLTKSIGDALSNCYNLRKIDTSLPIDNYQLFQISTNCKHLKDISLNSFQISDKGIESALSNLINLEHISISPPSHSSYISLNPPSTITPATLYSISSLKNLKSLKFSLPPQYGNHKSLIEHGIIFENSEYKTDIDKAIISLSRCKSLEFIELNSCNITEMALKNLISQMPLLNHLSIYQNSSLTSLCIKSNTLRHLTLSCVPSIQHIDIESNSLEELYVEGCESLQNTTLEAFNLKLLSLVGIGGKLNVDSCFNINSLALSEYKDITQKQLERLIDSLVHLKELYIFLHHIDSLRISSTSLENLDFQAWCGIHSCVLDCPRLKSLQASESTIESLYLKGERMDSIQLVGCDWLRTIIIDVVSCNEFTFTQINPSSIHPSTSKYLDSNNSNKSDEDNEDDEENIKVGKRRNKKRNSRGDQHMTPTALFLQSHLNIGRADISSENMIGKLSARYIQLLVVRSESLESLDLSDVTTVGGYDFDKYNDFEEIPPSSTI